MRTSRTWGPASAGPTGSDVTFSTPSGNLGNLTAGLMMKRAGLPIGRFVAATNAIDVGNPSNFERLMWLYAGDLEALKRDLVGSRHDDDEVRATIRRIYDERGYLLDPHSAADHLGLKSFLQSDAHL